MNHNTNPNPTSNFLQNLINPIFFLLCSLDIAVRAQGDTTVPKLLFSVLSPHKSLAVSVNEPEEIQQGKPFSSAPLTPIFPSYSIYNRKDQESLCASWGTGQQLGS